MKRTASLLRGEYRLENVVVKYETIRSGLDIYIYIMDKARIDIKERY